MTYVNKILELALIELNTVEPSWTPSFRKYRIFALSYSTFASNVKYLAMVCTIKSQKVRLKYWNKIIAYAVFFGPYSRLLILLAISSLPPSFLPCSSRHQGSFRMPRFPFAPSLPVSRSLVILSHWHSSRQRKIRMELVFMSWDTVISITNIEYFLL